MISVAALQKALSAIPDNCMLQKNAVGNLSVLNDWQKYIGFIDLRTGVFEENEKDE